MSNYVIWTQKSVNYACILDQFENVEKQFQFRKGISRINGFPANACFTQDMDFPNNTLLIDNLVNTNSLIVASERLKKFLEKQALPHVEYLPVTILDHKGKVASDCYYIIHPIDSVDCLDVDKCGPTWGRIAKDSIKTVDRLVLDEDKIDPERKMFRLQKFLLPVIVHRELAEAIDQEGFEGVRWVDIDDYPES